MALLLWCNGFQRFGERGGASSNANLNPRLLPSSVSKEDQCFAQLLKGGSTGSPATHPSYSIQDTIVLIGLAGHELLVMLSAFEKKIADHARCCPMITISK